jgi:phage tail-like protein
MEKTWIKPARFDPYKNFKFRIKIGSSCVAGLSKATNLCQTGSPVEYRRGGTLNTMRKILPKTYEAIILEHGVTYDTAFALWANQVTGTSNASRKNIILEIYNEAGKLFMAYKIFNCWVSEYQAIPDLDANANAVAIEHIKLENEGWERDSEFAEPAEPD